MSPLFDHGQGASERLGDGARRCGPHGRLTIPALPQLLQVRHDEAIGDQRCRVDFEARRCVAELARNIGERLRGGLEEATHYVHRTWRCGAVVLDEPERLSYAVS